MGATKFSRRCLQATLDAGCNVVGCATTPEIFRISYAPGGVRNVNYFDFAAEARALGIPCVPYDRNNTAFLSEVKKLSPDLLLVAGWYYMVGRELRATAPLGAVGLHGSLLPKYRGGAPLVWTMIHGENKGGLSLFYLDDGVDTGDIIGQESFPIEENETIAHALAKMEDAAASLLGAYLPLLATGRAPRIPQDHNQATIFPQRTPNDGEIDWNKSPTEIRAFIRAQTRPYPGAYTRIGGKKVILWDADIIPEDAPSK